MKFGYTIVYVPDVLKALEFYENSFSLKRRFIDEAEMYAELDTGNTILAFASEKVREVNGINTVDNKISQIPAGIEIAFIADDVQKSYDHAIKTGCTPLKSPQVKPWGQTVSYVRDLNGILVEICSAVS